MIDKRAGGERGALVRPATVADAAAIAAVHVASWQTTYRGVFPDDVLDGLDVAERERTWAAFAVRERCSLLALEDAGAIVGFACAGPTRTGADDFELYAIYLLATHQRRGGGTLLFRAIVDAVRGFGGSSLVLWVLEGNPAESFYRAMGGIPSEHREDTFAGQPVTDIAFRWPAL